MDRVLNGRYRLGPKIGDGGMAIVYRGLDVRLGRTVAIKVLREQFASDPQFVARFDREAQAVAALNHPNITGIFDVGSDFDEYGEAGFDRPYFVMEFIDGPNLKEWIRAHAPLPVDEAVAIVTQVLSGLGYAHARALVHRDIKPQNIMLSQDGTVKVTDFGIAKGLGDTTLTDAGTGLGTVHYISPEQARGEPATPASDLYAVGVVLYEMLTGRLPFSGDSQIAVAMKHVHEQPTPPHQFNPEVPAPLSAFVLRALAKDPNSRFLSARMMAQSLADWPNFREQPVRAGASRAAVAQRPAVVAGRTAVLPQRPAGIARRHEAPTLVDRPRSTQAAPRRPAAAVPPPPVARNRVDGIGCATWLAGAFVLVMLIAVLVVGYRISPFGAPAAQPTEPRIAVLPPDPTETPAATSTPDPGTATPIPTSTPFTLPAAQATPSSRPSAAPSATARPTQAASPTLEPTVAPTETPKPSPTGTATAVLAAAPNLLGRTLSQAQATAKEAGFAAEQIEARYSEQPAGTVIEQRPAAGTRLAKGATIGVVISRGQQTVAVPDVKGQSFERAAATLRELGLVVERNDVPSRNVEKGVVLDQDPLGGNEAKPGGTITLSVSLGDVVLVPDFFGVNFEAARKQLTDAGFVVLVNGQTKDQITKENPTFFTVYPNAQDGHVISQSLPAESYQSRGATIAIAYYKAK